MLMCRACLATEKDMVPFDEVFVCNYNLLTNLKIGVMDGMPQVTCSDCFETVNVFMEFRNKSVSSESTLKELLQAAIKSEERDIQDDKKTIHEDIYIKREIKDELKIEDTNSDSAYEFQDTYEEIDYQFLKEMEVQKSNKCSRKLRVNESKVSDIKEEDDGKLSCGICIKIFDSHGELECHLKNHKNDKHCQLCAEVFDGWSQLLGHRLKHVPPKQKQCHICRKRFVSCEYLEYHYRNVHVTEEGTKLRCKQCSSLYDNPRKLKKHIWSMHGEKKYTCDYCSKRFQSKSVLRAHVVSHTGNKAYVCDICGFRSKFTGGLKDHKIRRHSTTKVYCKSCRRPFQNQQDHDKHKCDEKVVMCPVCGIQFSRTMKLSRHMNTHSDVSKFECTRCPSKFKTKYALKAHLDRHDGNRTQHCQYCPAKFYTGSSLIKHRRIHTGEKPYVCKVCNKGFTGNHNLKVHMKVHGEYNLIVKKSKEPEATEATTIR